MSGVYQLRPRQSGTLHSVLPVLMRDREERRRVNVRAIDLAHERNAADQCADCGAQLGVRVRIAYDIGTQIVRCLKCAGKRAERRW